MSQNHHRTVLFFTIVIIIVDLLPGPLNTFPLFLAVLAFSAVCIYAGLRYDAQHRQHRSGLSEADYPPRANIPKSTGSRELYRTERNSARRLAQLLERSLPRLTWAMQHSDKDVELAAEFLIEVRTALDEYEAACKIQDLRAGETGYTESDRVAFREKL